MNDLPEKHQKIIKTHPALWHCIKSELRQWTQLEVCEVYHEISSPRGRHKAVAALKKTQRIAAGLSLLIARDGRFSVPHLYALTQLAEWIEEIKPDGGPTPQLPIATCAELLAFWFREYTGKPRWETINEIIKRWFDGAPTDIKELLKRRMPDWWKRFKERTLVMTPWAGWEVEKQRDQEERELKNRVETLRWKLTDILQEKLSPPSKIAAIPWPPENITLKRQGPEEKRFKIEIQKAKERVDRFSAWINEERRIDQERVSTVAQHKWERIWKRREAEEKRQAIKRAKIKGALIRVRGD